VAKILVTDGEQRAALAIVRSLGIAGHEIHVASETGRSISGASRYARVENRVPPPLTNLEGNFSEIRRLIVRFGIDLLIPVTEASLLSILPRQKSLPCLVPFSTADAFNRVSDKRGMAEIAREIGIAVPESTVVLSAEEVDLLSLAAGETYVLKPSRSVEGGRKLSVSYAVGTESVSSALQRLRPEAFPVLVQERIQGPGAGVFLLIWDGELRAIFGHRRIREKPPSGGVSVVRESAEMDPTLVESALQLMRYVGWQGVAMVEFKIDSDSGVPYLMEINGRFWGSLQLAIDAGVDFPRLLVDAALGHPPQPMPAYEAGVRTRWELGDLDHLLLRFLRAREALNLPEDAPSRTSAFRDFFGDFRSSTNHEVFRSSDPHPFFRELGQWIGDLWDR